MKSFLLLLVLAGTLGVSSVNATASCKNCKKSDYSSRNSDNNKVVKKNGIGRNGVAAAAGVGGEKLSHKSIHSHMSQQPHYK